MATRGTRQQRDLLSKGTHPNRATGSGVTGVRRVPLSILCELDSVGARSAAADRAVGVRAGNGYGMGAGTDGRLEAAGDLFLSSDELDAAQGRVASAQTDEMAQAGLLPQGDGTWAPRPPTRGGPREGDGRGGIDFRGWSEVRAVAPAAGGIQLGRLAEFAAVSAA